MGRGSKGLDRKVLANNESRVEAASLIKGIVRIAGAFIDGHGADIRIAKQRPLDASHAVICRRVRAFGASAHVHDANIEAGELAGNFAATIDWHFLAGVWIDANIASEEELVGVATYREVEDAGVFQKELPLLRKEKFVGREIELVEINVGVGKISVRGEVGNQV